MSRAAIRTGLLAATGARLAYAALRRCPPGGSSSWIRANHRGDQVTLLEGPAVTVAAAVAALLAGTGPGTGPGTGQGAGASPGAGGPVPGSRQRAALGLALAGTGAGAFGRYDDLAGSAARRGFRGHLGALAHGELTSGAVKIVGIGATGLTASALLDGRPAAGADLFINAGLVAAAANLLNLFDLRPGRAIKVVIAAGLPLAAGPGPAARAAAAPLGAALAMLPEDLGERAMLGDAGANALGAMLGAAAAGLRRPARLAVLAGLVTLTAASEFVSFTKIIERTPPLRRLDMLGRRPADPPRESPAPSGAAGENLARPAAEAAPLRVALVLGTAAGGTARHVAMLAAGCARRGLMVTVIGPESTRRLVIPPGPVPPGSSAGAEPPGTCPAARSIFMISKDLRRIRPKTLRDHEILPSPGEVGFGPAAIGDRPQPVLDAATVLRLRRLLGRIRPDVVHAHGLRAGAMAALALPRRAAAPAPALLVTVHNAPPAGLRAGLAYRILEVICARRADAIGCVSADLQDRMRRRGGRQVSRAIVPAPRRRVPSAAAVTKARSDIGADGRPVVLAVGRLAPQKGYDVLLAAASRWQRREPRPLLAIAGAGPLAAELAAISRDQGIDARFLGQRDDVPALLAAADVFVVASRWEGQPLGLQEALQAGLAVVAVGTGGVLDLTGEHGALLVPPGDPARLATAVLSVLDDRDLAAELAARATAAWAKLPSETAAVAAAIDLYVSAARQPGLQSVPRRPG